jgi:hypothetical protein
MILDAKLRWKPHVKKQQEELKLKYRKMYWLMSRSSALSVYNKLMLYQLVKPIWTYGIQLLGCTSQSNKNIIQRLQNRVLRDIVDAPWYIRNDNLRKDLSVETINSVIKKYAQRHKKRLHRHNNVEALQLLDNGHLVRRLHRTKPFELVRSTQKNGPL